MRDRLLPFIILSLVSLCYDFRIRWNTDEQALFTKRGQIHGPGDIHSELSSHSRSGHPDVHSNTSNSITASSGKPGHMPYSLGL